MAREIRISWADPCKGWTHLPGMAGVPGGLTSKFMQFILFIYLKTKRMKTNWKKVLLYIVRLVGLLLTGAAGGALGSNL